MVKNSDSSSNGTLKATFTVKNVNISNIESVKKTNSENTDENQEQETSSKKSNSNTNTTNNNVNSNTNKI